MVCSELHQSSINIITIICVYIFKILLVTCIFNFVSIQENNIAKYGVQCLSCWCIYLPEVYPCTSCFSLSANSVMLSTYDFPSRSLTTLICIIYTSYQFEHLHFFQYVASTFNIKHLKR